MPSIVICEPVGAFRGVFSGLTAAELATSVLTSLLARTGLGAEDVDDLVLGHCYPSGESPAIGRVAALDAGLGTSVPGWRIDRRCGSGLQAVLYAGMQVAAGAAGLVIAGGAESMSQVEHYALGLRSGVSGDVQLTDRLAWSRVTGGGKRHPVPGGMTETAENLRAQYGISREEQDELAAESQRRCAEAVAAGRFDDETVGVEVSGRRGADLATITRDEHPRPGTTVGTLATLPPIRRRLDPDSTVTAGNSSGQNDGAALCVVTTADNAARLGLRALLRIRSWAVAGVGPRSRASGRCPPTAAALERAGLTLADIDLIELNEAFAAQVLACLREWRFGEADGERVKVNGPGIFVGHRAGATGARILATLAHEMHRRGARLGLATMCIGGGQGLAAVFGAVR